MRPVTPTEAQVPAPTPYYLTPAARAALQQRAAEIRQQLALRRALRQAHDAVANAPRPLP
jgi:hypothetical protein